MGCSTSEEKYMKEKGVLLGVGLKHLWWPSACSLDQWRRYYIDSKVGSTTQLNGLINYGFGEIVGKAFGEPWTGGYFAAIE